MGSCWEVCCNFSYLSSRDGEFNIWSFDGKLLYWILEDHFFQFSWRPRSPSLFSLEKEEEIAKNLKKYKAEDQDVSML
ncbi:Eukaryotic translation initiation factor 3 subunit B [Ancistrocladus abbreviatus]